MSEWTFFSNHAHVLFIIAKEDMTTIRELANKVGITERFAQKIINDLHEEGFINIEKNGRNNLYTVNQRKRLRHPVEAHVKIGHLIDLIGKI